MSKLLHDTISPGTKSDILQAAVVLIIDPTTQKKKIPTTQMAFSTKCHFIHIYRNLSPFEHLMMIQQSAHFICKRNHLFGASKITANIDCNCVHLYWQGCVICSIYICGNI